jgi:two-component system, chemotaxis family, chemotaxis protein CheY
MLKKIMVVDDSVLLHNMYKLILAKYTGVELIKAMDGEEGLRKLSLEPGVDLILLDINMPVMNGLQFLETMRRQPEFSRIPVIIVSTEGKEADTRRGLKMGANGYIVKPFRSGELHGLIESVCPETARASG